MLHFLGVTQVSRAQTGTRLLFARLRMLCAMALVWPNYMSMCMCGMTAGREQALEALQCSMRGRLRVSRDSTAGTKGQGRGFGRGEWQQAPVIINRI